MILEQYTGKVLRLSKRITKDSIIEDKSKNCRRLKIDKLNRLTPENEQELSSTDFVIFFIPHHKLHDAPRVDTRGFRYLSWEVTDMRDNFAIFLFYGEASDLMKKEIPGYLWMAIKPQLLPPLAKQRASQFADTRRTLSVSSVEQLVCIGKLEYFGTCMEIIRGTRLCRNPIDSSFHGNYCQLHKIQQNVSSATPTVTVNSVSDNLQMNTTDKNNLNSTIVDVNSNSHKESSALDTKQAIKDELHADNPKEKVKNVTAAEIRAAMHVNRLQRLTHFHAFSEVPRSQNTPQTGKEDIPQATRKEIVDTLCNTLVDEAIYSEPTLQSVRSTVMKLKALELDKAEIAAAMDVVGPCLARLRQSCNTDLASSCFILDRQWKRKLKAGGDCGACY